MVIKKFNVSKPEQYQKGQEIRTMWHNIGTMTEFHKDDGSIGRIIEIPAIGLKANIFPFQDKKDVPKSKELPEINIDEEVNPEDLPF